jgi:hypothetical protein
LHNRTVGDAGDFYAYFELALGSSDVTFNNGSGAPVIFRNDGDLELKHNILFSGSGNAIHSPADSGIGITVEPGAETGSTVDGNTVSLTGGESDTGHGGDINLTGGAAVSGSARGGDVVVLQSTSAGGRVGGLRIASSHTPASSSEACTTGQIHWDSGFVYVCVTTNTWKRSALSAF